MTNRLKEMRFKRMMTAADLARESGISRSTIWKIEKGRTDDITTRTMKKLADALKVPVSEVFRL